MKCEIMKEQLKNAFTSLSFEKCTKEKVVKLEQGIPFLKIFLREHLENFLSSKSATKNTPQNRKISLYP